MKGEYTLLITGPAGVALTATLDLSSDRHRPATLAVDPEVLQELLVVTAICGGAIESELIKEREAS